MERNHLILLLVLGILIVLYTFMSLQWTLGIIIAAIILCAFLYSDFKVWRESTKTDLKKIEERVEALERKQ